MTTRTESRNRAAAFVAALAVSTVALAAVVATSSAHQVSPYQYDKSFNGADSTGGAFSKFLSRLDINQSNGMVYALDATGEGFGSTLKLSQFNAAGEAQNWSGLAGVSSFSPGGGSFQIDMTFDNSGHGGGLYIASNSAGTAIKAYRPDGTLRLAFGEGQTCGVGVNPIDGRVLLGSGQSGTQYNPETGVEVDSGDWLIEQDTCKITVDAEGYFWLNKFEPGFAESRWGLWKYGKGDELPGFFKPNPKEVPPIRFTYVPAQSLAIDRSTNRLYAAEGSRVTEYSTEGQPINTFGLAEGAYAGLVTATGIAVNEATHDVYVTSHREGVGQVDIFHQAAPVTVPDATTVAAGHPDATSGVLKGVVNPDGVKTKQCKFEWGATTQYTNGVLPCSEGNEFEGTGDQSVSAEVKSLTTGNEYHYRVVAKNGNEQWSYGADRTFEASTPPTSSAVLVDRVNTDGARFTATVNPHGGTTRYHFEVGEADCSSNPCVRVPEKDAKLLSRLSPEEAQAAVSGLKPDTFYYVRLVAENGAGQALPFHIFRTYPAPPSDDPCANAHVRQQTSAFLLPDCRAYELVSAQNAGGYDVESDLVPGETPLSAYPDARNRLLYGLHFGSVPGIAGSPTNYGVDPYVAERGEDGWTTRYVGLPADGMADPAAFGSPLLGADERLDSFAFGGTGICDPCFGGLGTNLPLRLDGATPIPGMAGSLEPGESAPAGEVRKYLSADGSHLIFGSIEKFEPAGNEGGGVTIYERDLNAGTTRIVSTDASGSTLTGPGIAGLDISSDGSRVVVGKRVSTDTAGNDHYHLYMHLGTSANSADLTPGGGSSALFDGMTADGSRAFFTTTDKLLGTDTDESADIYEAEVSPAGAVTLGLVSVKSTGAASNDDGCTPPGSPDNWNTPSGEEGKCSAVAFAGGAGVAASEGSFYFVSPEQLEGAEGEPDQANLYVVPPGSSPHFVETIDSSLVKPGTPTAKHPTEKTSFTGGSASGPESIAVDQSNGDVYVAETGAGKVSRFKSDGTAHNFTEGTGAGTNSMTATIPGFSESGLAVDSSGGVFDGDLYVAGYPGLKVYSSTGAEIGSLNGSGTSAGSFSACGVAVDQSNGALYVGDYGGHIWRYLPTGSAPITDADYTVTGVETQGMNPCQVATDSAGDAYAANWANGPVKEFQASTFTFAAPAQSGTLINNKAFAINADPSTNELFVNEGNQISVFKANGEKITTFGTGSISNSRGVAINETTHHAYAPNGTSIVEFGYNLPPYAPIDNPGVVHGVKQAGTPSTADFQVTRDGRFAVFTSSLQLVELENLGHSEIYRYDALQDEIDCASCATTGAPAKFDTFLSPYGINLSEDGRVFYTTLEALVLSDTNEQDDAYEWEGADEVGRISTGGGNSASSLLSVSRDGGDAFFFTRQTLVPSDENGGAVKVYDAREGGGYATFPDIPPCAASDECHGAGTQAAPPPNINSLSPSDLEQRGTRKPKHRCRKGLVRRHGKCVKKRSSRKHQGRGRRTGKRG